jgi:hypothetical protein
MKRVVLVLAFLALANWASSQTVTNPTKAEFTASADHATITLYEIAWFTGATQVGTVVDIGKPTPDANQLCLVTINTQPLPFATYTAKVRAKAGTVYSEWSLASNPFDRVPAAPGSPTVKK